MKLWRWIVLLLVVAVLAAWGWHWIAADPGYVLIRLRGWRIESTLVVAVVILLLVWALVGLAVRLLRWPFGAVSRRQQRLGRTRMAQGLVGLYEGRHGAAERALQKAARYTPMRAPALLAAADAARRNGAHERALQWLDEATELAPQAARVLRARSLRESGQPGQAVQLLSPEADSGTLPPAGWRELAEAALANGQPQRALQALAPLRKTGAMGSVAFSSLQTRVIVAALADAVDAETLARLWRSLPRAERNDSRMVVAYAERAAQMGAQLAAMSELEAALRRQWDPQLVKLYAALDGGPVEQRLRQAESWLKAHADDADLLAALGSLCGRVGVLGKARDYLQRSLALKPAQSLAWSAMGEVSMRAGDQADAAQCYRNALAYEQGWTPGDAQLSAPSDALEAIVEERDQHGVPRLPASTLTDEDEGA